MPFVGLILAALTAGFVDAAVGGGGLIQVPALLAALPQSPVATLFGTNKLASVFGTASASWRYFRHLAIPWMIVVPAALAAFVFSFVGAGSVAVLPRESVRPVVVVLLVAVVAYVWRKPELGFDSAGAVVAVSTWKALVVGAMLGFYDGFFGPGTGSFLIFCFVRFFGMNFLSASAAAKLVNLATNVAALSFFVPSGNVLVGLGLAMATANVVGAQLGSRTVLRGGSALVRKMFLGVAICLIAKVVSDSI